VVIDFVGGKTLEMAWKVATSAGILTSIAQPPEIIKPSQGIEDAVRSFWFIVEADMQ
jgi:hypothetical protein